MDFCCWFGWIICRTLIFSMQFGMETLFTFLLNHQRFDHFHWFLLLFFIIIDFYEMRWNEKGKGQRKQKQQAASSQQPASQQYICQYKIQPIVPNTFSNKESIAHKDSLHNLLEKVYSLYSIDRGGFTNDFPTLVCAREAIRKRADGMYWYSGSEHRRYFHSAHFAAHFVLSTLSKSFEHICALIWLIRFGEPCLPLQSLVDLQAHNDQPWT